MRRMLTVDAGRTGGGIILFPGKDDGLVRTPVGNVKGRHEVTMTSNLEPIPCSNLRGPTHTLKPLGSHCTHPSGSQSARRRSVWRTCSKPQWGKSSSSTKRLSFSRFVTHSATSEEPGWCDSRGGSCHCQSFAVPRSETALIFHRKMGVRTSGERRPRTGRLRSRRDGSVS